jgi:hypothetical protein
MADNRKKPPTAHSLEEAANSDNSLEGYAAANANDHDEIAKIAYCLYQDRGCEHGQDQDDWFRAEREYRQRQAQKTPARAAGD